MPSTRRKQRSTKIRTANWDKKKRALEEDALRTEVIQNEGPKKKPALYPQATLAQSAQPGAAKGYLLSTSSLSDEDSNSNVEVEVRPALARAIPDM